MKSQNFAIALMLTLFVSCAKWGSVENDQLMQQAQALFEQMPDSALMLLDMVNAAPFNRAQTAEYTLLRVQARTNADKDLTTDSEIFQAWEYFAEKKNAEKAALAGFYASWVAKAQKNPALEMEYHLKALPFAEKAKNLLLTGKIYQNMGFLNYIQQLNYDAVTNYRKALRYFNAAGNLYQREITINNAMANAFMIENLIDSAQFYYQAALELANLHDDTAMKVWIYNNISVTFRELGQLDTAIHYCRKALSLTRNENEKTYIYKNLANVFLKKNDIDSAWHYFNKVEPLYSQVKNPFAQASLNHLRFQIEKAGENYREALISHEAYVKYQDTLTDLRSRQLLLELQKKYDTASVANEYQLRQNRLWKSMTILGFVVLALMGIVIYFLSENRKKDTALKDTEKDKMEQQKALEKMVREKADAVKKIETLQNMYQTRENDIKTKMLEKLGFYKEMAIFNLKFEVWKKELPKRHANEIECVISKFKLDIIVDTANEIFPVLVEKLKLAGLKDNEIDACCLIVCGFTNSEIAGLMNKSLETIEKWKTAIRNKLEMGQRGDIKKYLLENLSISTSDRKSAEP